MAVCGHWMSPITGEWAPPARVRAQEEGKGWNRKGNKAHDLAMSTREQHVSDGSAGSTK